MRARSKMKNTLLMLNEELCDDPKVEREQAQQVDLELQYRRVNMITTNNEPRGKELRQGFRMSSMYQIS